ncbi:MAG: LD-carboxypeptidase [bacterium]|nr:LD-carboxypeptidase [bacterium]
MGYSDITVLNVALWQQTGLVTFNGPALLTDFAEYPDMLSYTEHAFLSAVTQDEPIGALAPAAEWTEELLDWGKKDDLQRGRRLTPSSGWTWLREGYAEGVLVGGCISSLQHLRGTRFWPDLDGAILFLETSEEKPVPATVDGILMDYENMGVFDSLAGLLFGRPMYYTDEEKQLLREVIATRTAAFDFPVVTDMDFGHTAPQLVLPIGCRARIDTRRHLVEVLARKIHEEVSFLN